MFLLNVTYRKLPCKLSSTVNFVVLELREQYQKNFDAVQMMFTCKISVFFVSAHDQQNQDFFTAYFRSFILFSFSQRKSSIFIVIF